MAKLTWLGAEDYREGESPLESCVWCGVLFTALEPVEVTDPWMIAKARGNRFFKVEGGDPSNMIGAPRPEMWTEPMDDDALRTVSFFDDPPGVGEAADPPLPLPPDYPPEDEPKRRRGRRERGNGDHQ